MPRSLVGQVLVVTGASSGIGRATALAAAGAGMDLVVTARREDRLREAAEAIERLGRRVRTVQGDVAEPGFSARLLDEAEAAFGRFDAVFANAGYGTERRALDIDDDAMRRLFDVNFFASVDLVRTAADRLVRAGRPGHLLMCSSCMSRFSFAGYGAYAATKSAQAMYCQGLRHELREHDVYVSTVHPITTRTEFFDVASGTRPANGAGAVAGHARRYFVQTPERVARAVVRCLRRPVPEVWTSFPARLGAGLFTVFPRLGDFFLQPHVRHLGRPERGRNDR